MPSLLGIDALPPYYHNGACESLACVVGNVKHRTANGKQPDRLPNARDRALVVKFLKSIDARTQARSFGAHALVVRHASRRE